MVRVAALAVFGLAWVLLLLVVLIGAGYGSNDPLLAAYFGVLVLGFAIVWRGVARNQTVSHAVPCAVLIVAALWLGSTYG